VVTCRTYPGAGFKAVYTEDVLFAATRNVSTTVINTLGGTLAQSFGLGHLESHL
jgi:hypothetical protein